MKVAIIGSGGREHALAQALAKSSKTDEIMVLPGNPGMLTHPKIMINQKSIQEIIKDAAIDLVVIGPEAPLAAGLSDELRKSGVKVFGPSQAAAMLETSKIFSKEIMRKAKIPTADFKTAENYAQAVAAVDALIDKNGIVLKADGLASGKGVVVCDDRASALVAIKMIFEKYQGLILIEKRLYGRELSALFLCLDNDYRCLGTACDYKRLLNRDQGPNTGGMGAYSPVHWMDKKRLNKIENEVVDPILKQMGMRGDFFQGMLFVGLMIDNDQMNVLEFNVRFGDPETQAILPRLEWDAFEALYAVANQDVESFKQLKITQRQQTCVHVVKASRGYPEQPEIGKQIKLGSMLENTDLYFGGVRSEAERLVTNGGRVLGVSAIGKNLEQARELAYEGIHHMAFEGAIYRSDIGEDHD